MREGAANTIYGTLLLEQVHWGLNLLVLAGVQTIICSLTLHDSISSRFTFLTN